MARNFDGSTQFGTIGAIGLTRTAGQPISIHCRGKPASASANHAEMLTNRNGSGAGDLCKLGRNGTQWYFEYDPTGSGGTAIGGTVTAGSQFSILGVYDGSSITLYVDGVQTAQVIDKPNAAIDQDNWGFAAQPDFTSSSEWDGDLAEGAIWDVALTADEAAALADGISPLLIRPASLVGYWPLWGRYSPEIDLIGGKNVTLTGAPPYADHPRMIYPTRQRIVLPGEAAPAAVTRQRRALLGVGI